MLSVEIRFLMQGKEVSVDSFVEVIVREVRASVREEITRTFPKNEQTMYGAFRKEKKGRTTRYKLVDKRIPLFGCQNGWIPWLVQMSTPKGQREPYKWHLSMEEALCREEARKYYAEQDYATDVNAILINVKPGSKKLFICELVDIWGFSSDGWTPMLWHLQVLSPEGEGCTPDRFGDFSVNEEDDHLYEFLYARGTFENGKLKDKWIAPVSSPTNGTLIWYPEPWKYFMGCVRA
jgi:hypothetical protein